MGPVKRSSSRVDLDCCCFRGNVFSALCIGLNEKCYITEVMINQGCLKFEEDEEKKYNRPFISGALTGKLEKLE